MSLYRCRYPRYVNIHFRYSIPMPFSTPLHLYGTLLHFTIPTLHAVWQELTITRQNITLLYPTFTTHTSYHNLILLRYPIIFHVTITFMDATLQHGTSLDPTFTLCHYTQCALALLDNTLQHPDGTAMHAILPRQNNTRLHQAIPLHFNTLSNHWGTSRYKTNTLPDYTIPWRRFTLTSPNMTMLYHNITKPFLASPLPHGVEPDFTVTTQYGILYY